MNILRTLPKSAHMILLTILVLISGCSGFIKPLDDIQISKIAAHLEQKGFRGIVAIQTDKTSYVVGIGDETTANGRANESTLVDIGSITKPITAAAILLLVEGQKLDLDDPLSMFFPNAPFDKSEITIHQLLTHSSGLPNIIGDDYEQNLTKDVFLKRAFRAKLKFKPGTSYNYSNTGYSLLAAIIEQITDISYEDYLRHELFKNAELTSIGYATAYHPEKSMLMETGEDIAAGSWGGQVNWALIGNGGLIATASDMISFQQKFNTGEILSPKSVQLAQSQHIRESPMDSHYGYGTVVEDHPRFGRLYWHNGSNGKFHANLTTYADKNLIVFTASNTPTFNADKAAELIANTLLKENGQRRIE